MKTLPFTKQPELPAPSCSACARLRAENQRLATRLKEGRDYLMQINPSKMTVEDLLMAFGWNSDGFEG